MIRTTKVTNLSKPTIFKLHPLAPTYCRGKGIEFGAAAHNPFGLTGSINIAPCDDLEVYRAAEVDMCGSYAEIDICAEAHQVPLEDESQNYIISSHVVEHLPNPLAAFVEWNRLLKLHSTIFMIIPLRDAHPPDRKRPISSLLEIVTAQREGYTVDNFPDKTILRRGHYFVYTLQLMFNVIDWANDYLGLNWVVVHSEEKDKKVGNGFTVVARKMG